MKTRFNIGNNNKQISNDDNTTQIQIGVNWWLIAIVAIIIIVLLISVISNIDSA